MFSCKKHDETKPSISYIYTNGDPSDFLHAIAGVENTLEVRVTDDFELSQLKMKLSTVAGIHQHIYSEGEPIHAFMDFNQGVWDTIRIDNISGKDLLRNYTLQIPDTVSGGWKLEVAVLDEEGNITTTTTQLNIQNDRIPAISVAEIFPEPNQDGTIQILVGDSVVLNGLVIDADTLDYVRAEVTSSSAIIWSQEFTSVNNWNFSLQSFQAPPLNSTGTYYYYIHAGDIDGWHNTVRAKIVVE